MFLQLPHCVSEELVTDIMQATQSMHFREWKSVFCDYNDTELIGSKIWVWYMVAIFGHTMNIESHVNQVYQTAYVHLINI